MTREATLSKPKFLLLDANIVVETHSLGVWNSLIGAASITLPATVARREARYYGDHYTGEKIRIQLDDALNAGQIEVAQATGEELQDFLGQFDRVFAEGLDAGEAEALALLAAGHLPDYRFCTGDRPAIQALALIGLSERGTSLEAALKSVGLTKRLLWPFTDSFFKLCLREGQEMRVQGFGLTRDSRYRLR